MEWEGGVMMEWEGVLREVILPDLDKGRPDFDRPHTEAVVYWVKEICKAESGLDEKVLVTAAYAHDWGYIGLFDDGVTDMADINSKKKRHMEVGAEKIERLLRERLSEYFSEKEIERVRHLVYMHDRVEELRDEDEIALMEADTLGALDTSRVKPTFTKRDNERYIEEVRRRRRPRFRHKEAIRVFEDVLKRRVDFYEDRVE